MLKNEVKALLVLGPLSVKVTYLEDAVELDHVGMRAEQIEDILLSVDALYLVELHDVGLFQGFYREKFLRGLLQG